MIAGVGSLRTCVLVVEAYDVFNSLDIGALELAEVFVHQIVAFYLVDGKLRDFLFAMLPVYCQRLGLWSQVYSHLTNPIHHQVRYVPLHKAYPLG